MSGFSEEITLEGHLIDSWILPKVFDTVMDLGGSFDLQEIHVGRRKDETTFARLKVTGTSDSHLDSILTALQQYGAVMVSANDVRTVPAPCNGALPDEFYSTTHMPTEVRMKGRWLPVEGTEMDLAIVVNPEQMRARMVPMAEIRKNDSIVVGHEGIRVMPPQRSREREIFSFMGSDVSSERPKRLVIDEIARQMREIRSRKGKIVVVAGPAIVHSGAGPHLARMIRAGFVQALFGGNAIATHDVESALMGTSLGVALKSGQPVEGGHRHHMYAINAIRRAGSLRAAVDAGILKEGIMYECIKNNVDVVLAGSVRDDGPLPDVITDMAEAQRRMRESVKGAEMALMIATMLHSIATGNLLPASVKVVAVDINPAVVTKLADRGTFQALGLVTDAELFVRELAQALEV
ncbi:MAG TPA: TIGR00300 family protein [Terriglobales bacterium]|jgi:lysine-ketoglutarate reductase/saccharopine dehydrogenase-like protein (TIGR00300 family)|nr:TIGR00300 family protein [Terriglobales bacterium]